MIEGHIYTEGIVKRDYPETLKKQIASLSSDCEVIIHHISSPGGDVYAAWKALPELMKIGKPIKSSIEGEASSIASWIAVAPAFEVEATDPSTAMIHEPFFPEGIQSSLGVDDLETAKIELSQIRQSMAEAYAKKSGKPVDEWLALMKKNTRMTAQMLKAHGLVDKITPIEPRRIAAEFIEEIKQEIKNFKTDVMNIFKKHPIPAANATAVDLPVKGGKMLHVESENGDLVNKPATIDGAPAEGSYQLEDGRVLMCKGGIVTAVEQATATPPPDDSAQKIQQLEAQLQAMRAAEAAKTAAEAEKARLAAEQAEKDKVAAELKEKEIKIAAMAKEMDELKKKTIGDDTPPVRGSSPFAIGSGNNIQREALYATRTFLANNMEWMEQYYANGRFKDGTHFRDYRTDGPNAVSILETNLNYTWNGVLSTELFFKPTLGSPALADIFTIDLGAADKKRYHIAPTANKVLKPYTGCDQALTGSSFDITSKAIQLKPFQMYESWCKDDFTGQLTGLYNVLAQEWLKTGNESFDPAGTPIDRMIMELLKDSLRRDIFRRVSFGDTTSSNADWNQIDGLWQSLIDQSGASNYCVYASKTNFGTGTLSADAAYNELTAMYNNSSNLLKQEGIDGGKGKFLVTRSIWQNLYTSYTGLGAVTELAYTAAVKGLGSLTFRGIPVIPITIWDDFLADSTNPLSATTRHLIAFTVKDNHILGIQNTADLNKIDSWFEKKDNKRYYRSNMVLGFLGAIHCDLTTISY